uniref:peptidylprolyl isomerase n=2 Tax=Macrostomum lignano TaxID=282301 RepID=A0A1I8HWJ4_9PLAT
MGKFKPRCFFDVALPGEDGVHRIVFELFNDVVPLTCENFRHLCLGDKVSSENPGQSLHYKDSIFHRVIKGFMIQGGDIAKRDGTGGESIYGGRFKDENFDLKHDRPFLLSMANKGRDANGSQFFITTTPASHLDNKHVVFGQVLDGQDVVKRIENQPVNDEKRPVNDITIVNCGELVPVRKKKPTADEADASTGAGVDASDGADGETTSKKKAKKAKKEKKKKEKKEKKSKKDKKNKKDAEDGDREDGELADDEPLCSVRPDEIPPSPKRKFLSRYTGPPRENASATRRVRRNESPELHYSSNQRRSFARNDASGLKVKGRGNLRYRGQSQSASSGDDTPPHWKAASRGLKKMTDDDWRQYQRNRDSGAAAAALGPKKTFVRSREEDEQRDQKSADKSKDANYNGQSEDDSQSKRRPSGSVDRSLNSDDEPQIELLGDDQNYDSDILEILAPAGSKRRDRDLGLTDGEPTTPSKTASAAKDVEGDTQQAEERPLKPAAPAGTSPPPAKRQRRRSGSGVDRRLSSRDRAAPQEPEERRRVIRRTRRELSPDIDRDGADRSTGASKRIRRPSPSERRLVSIERRNNNESRSPDANNERRVIKSRMEQRSRSPEDELRPSPGSSRGRKSPIEHRYVAVGERQMSPFEKLKSSIERRASPVNRRASPVNRHTS